MSKKKKVSPSEAIYGFAAWLSTRKSRTVFASNVNCAPIADRVKEYCEANGFEDPGKDYPGNLTMPAVDV